MIRTLNRLLDYCDTHAWPGQAMYWGGFILLMSCTFHLDTWLYAGSLAAGLIMHWGGLITGGRMAREWLEDRP